MLTKAFLLSATIVLAAPTFAQDAATTPPAAEATAPATVNDPPQFATMAAIGNMFELESSTLAIERGTSEEVKAFAEQMIADHTKAAQDMAPAAAEEGVETPTELDERHREMLDELSGLEGEEFDAAYLDAQVAAHDEAVALFEGYSSAGPEGALKTFATATLPTLQQHQQHVKELAGQ